MSILVLSSCSEDGITNSKDENQLKIATLHKIAQDLDAEITIDKNINESNAILINSEEEYRTFITNVKNKLKNENALNFGILNDGSQMRKAGCENGVYSGSGMSSGLATLNFDVSVSGGCISGISGGFNGVSIGVSYTQGGTSYGCNSGTVCGSVNYNIFFEGIGTIYSERVCYKISLSC